MYIISEKILDAADVTKLLELKESTENRDKTSYPSTYGIPVSL